MIFIESKIFTKRVTKLVAEDEYKDMQKAILLDLKSGDEILKKTYKRRFKARGHGARGGCRVIYWHSSDEIRVLMLFVFAKNEKDNITHEELKDLKAGIEILEELYDG
jgi:hypothetical protein